MKKRGFLQISFAWLFAIIVGAVILTLAIYGVTKTVDIGETTVDAKTAKEISVLLNPLETGFEIGKTTTIILPAETRIYSRCNSLGNFGKQGISVSQKSFNQWTETDVEVSFENKYIFSDNYVEGKAFYIFSKPFEFPFKVTDLLYITSSKDNYCFVNAPYDVKEELDALGQKNIFTENCENISNRITVCFGSSEECNVTVRYNYGQVEKDGEILYFETDALMYAAIFSDVSNYECQIKRIMKRVGSLADIYSDKENFISSKGCNSNLEIYLTQLSNSANSLTSSASLDNIWITVEELEEKNKLNKVCPLW
ncbi:MAG: hypothetical protein OQK82_05455 [Candidatus Pacearchaeota archaeon]|nr:hypothetical protein [Candidatus Pacearchaeota archaeon]